jgi:hypothetical protein
MRRPAAVGGVTEAEMSFETCTRGWKAGEATQHRQRGGNRGRAQQRWLTGVEEGDSGGARPNGIEGDPFYRASTRTNGISRGEG